MDYHRAVGLVLGSVRLQQKVELLPSGTSLGGRFAWIVKVGQCSVFERAIYAVGLGSLDFYCVKPRIVCTILDSPPQEIIPF